VTLSVLRGLPFWRTLGWKKLNTGPLPQGRSLDVFLFWVRPGHLCRHRQFARQECGPRSHPELFKSRTGAMLLMAMAIFIAPLVEETVFRGYLYPLSPNLSASSQAL